MFNFQNRRTSFPDIQVIKELISYPKIDRNQFSQIIKVNFRALLLRLSSMANF